MLGLSTAQNEAEESCEEPRPLGRQVAAHDIQNDRTNGPASASDTGTERFQLNGGTDPRTLVGSLACSLLKVFLSMAATITLMRALGNARLHLSDHHSLETLDLACPGQCSSWRCARWSRSRPMLVRMLGLSFLCSELSANASLLHGGAFAGTVRSQGI